MSFIDYAGKKDPSTGSAFPADFGSKEAMNRADGYRRAINQQQIADRKAVRLERQAFREAMKSRDPGAMRDAARHVRNNPGIWGINTAQENRNAARGAVDMRAEQMNRMIRDDPALSEMRKNDLMRDQFGVSGEQRREAEQAREQDQVNQETRYRNSIDRFNRSLQNKSTPNVSPSSPGGLNTDPYKFFSRPSGMTPVNGGQAYNSSTGEAYFPDRDVRLDTYELSRYLSSAEEFNRRVNSNPEALLPLSRAVQSRLRSGDLSRADAGIFMEKAANVIRLVEKHGQQLGLSLDELKGGGDPGAVITRFYRELFNAGLTWNYPADAKVGPQTGRR